MIDTIENKRLKTIASVLGVVLLGVIIYTISLYRDKQATTEALQQEKEQVMTDLNRLKFEYDRAILVNDTITEELMVARGNIAQYMDSVQRMKTDIASLSRYRRQVRVLQSERTQLLRQIDSLTQSNTLLAMQRDSTFAELERQSVLNDSLIVQNIRLADMLERVSALNLLRFSVDAVREKNNGKFTSTSRARNTDNLKVCFTIAENGMAEAGDRSFFVEVLGPQGNVLGSGLSQLNQDGASLTYSTATNFYYENGALDVCDYIGKPATGFQEGDYMVNVYDDALNLLGTSTFTLK